MHLLTPETGFLGLETASATVAPDAPRVVVVPFGLEASVCYGGGTGRGPAAILAASHQVELFDEELWCEPVRSFRLDTLAEPAIPKDVAVALEALDGLCEAVVADGAFPFVLGGEHSLTAGAIRPHVRRHDDLAIVQLDAHGDLRDGYEGEPFSHASAMRRCLDHPQVTRLVAVGIRSISSEDAAFYDAHRDRVQLYPGHRPVDPQAVAAAVAGRKVYLTIDIDALDAARMPATGTPEPGGLGWYDALAIVRAVCEAADVVAADLVELAPIDGLHACDLTAARLACKVLAYRFATR